ncbi:MAG: ergothioneine biosynthesis glutamate--cysteine ligase EgtA [Nocardioidaceae bacterium]|nr:ergothioneine biosynthesis glutamate--cysteine ligase EgtA [Nocardioidaceae bacterium]
MTAQTIIDSDDAAFDPHHPVEAAGQHVADAALLNGTDFRVGLELEFHLVDLSEPGRRPDWSAVQSLITELPVMPCGSSVTVEPGGQLELSTSPQVDVVAAVSALRADREALRLGLVTSGYGSAPLGADPARPVRRVNPAARYAAMEQHFEAVGCAVSGKAMMSATAALQVNLDAGPATGWSDRMALIRSLIPILVAASSTSPFLGGRSSGWHSMRQETWSGIDHQRSDPVATGEPTQSWSDYALAAPVMLVRDGDSFLPVTTRTSFREWLRDPDRLGRPATVADLDYHLTTLFPPVRPRGYVEIRCIDALPDRWWPALAALTVILVDDPVAADAAAELCQPVSEGLADAARHGLRSRALAGALGGCVEVAVNACPAALRPDLEAFAELIASGRSPSSELRARSETDGALCVLEEEARA